MDRYNNLTTTQLLEERGLTRAKFNYRFYQLGWSFEQSLGDVPPPREVRSLQKYFTWEGKRYKTRELAEKFDMNYATFNKKIAEGYTLEEIFDMKEDIRRQRKKHLVNGELLTREEAAEKYNIARGTINRRISVYGMTLEEAVNIPVVLPKVRKTKGLMWEMLRKYREERANGRE